MAHRKFDLVQETSSSTGTGNMVLAGAVTRRRAFSAVLSNADTCYVLIENAAAAEWEICLATYVSAGNQLSRGAVLASSTGSTVSFSAGTKTISLIAPAAKSIVEDNNGDASITRYAAVGTGFRVGGVASHYQPVTTASGLSVVYGSGASDEKNWDWNTSATFLDLRLLTDAYSAANTAHRVARTGYTVNYQAWYTGSTTEAMRLNSTGLAIGRGPANAKLEVYGSTGLLVSPSADNSTNGMGVGLTGTSINSGGQASGRMYMTGANAAHAACLELRSGTIQLANIALYDTSNVLKWQIFGNGTQYCGAGIIPQTDNAIPFGTASFRWSVIYAGTGTINTSGRDTKVGIREATDAERRAARRILDIGPKLYQFRDAYDAKGESARLHAGYIAEDVRDALEAEGLDPWRYGFMCADELTRTEEYTETVERQKVRKVEATESAVEVVNGRPVMVTRTVEREEPVGRMVPVLDQDGTPVMVPGEPDAEGNATLVPMLHFVAEVETVGETRTREVATGEKRLGLRYSELEAFLKCAE